jgi:hypothetical protein
MIAHQRQPLSAAARRRDSGGICASSTGRVSVEMVVRVVSMSSLIGRFDYYLSGGSYSFASTTAATPVDIFSH